MLDRLVNVSVSISSAAMTAEGYNRMLVIGAAPGKEGAEFSDVASYSGMEGISSAGWKSGEPVYDAMEVAWMQEPSPRQAVVAVRKEKESGEKEPVSDTLQRAADSGIEWYGAAIAGGTDKDITEAAAWCESNDRLLFFVTAETGNVLAGEGYMRTSGIYMKTLEGKRAYAHVALMAVGFQYRPGEETWAYKTLRGIPVDALEVPTQEKAEDAKLNCYVSMAGRGITTGGITCGGEHIDVVRCRDWLQNRIQANIFNCFAVNPKIPYTSGGITLIESQVISALREGQEVGGVAGTEYVDDVEVPGYTVAVPRILDIPAEDRKKRRLTGIRFSARLTGAIHMTEIRGTLEY